MKKDLSHLVEEYEVISFDVFNTLLERIYQTPDDLFKAVEKQVDEVDDFVYQRKKAERKARKKCKFREVNLDEIYFFLQQVYDSNICQKLKEREISIEVQSAFPNLDIIPIYEKCKKLGKKIYIISDMYLDRNIISKLLTHIGISGYTKLYVSCDYRKTKWENGDLFKVVLSENHLCAKDVLHIGDDEKADIAMAQKCGLATFHVQTNKNYARYSGSSFIDRTEKESLLLLERFINITMPREESLAFQDGYEIFGPLLYNFMMWLKYQVRENKIEKILFFSRDGYILQQAYKLIDPNMPTEYFFASRRAVIVPGLCFSSQLSDIFKVYKSWPTKITIASFLNRVGIETDEVSDIIQAFGFSCDSKLKSYELQNNKNFIDFYEKLRPVIEDKAKKQYEFFIEYFNKACQCKKVAMVDIGAGCSIEIALRKLLQQSNCDVDLYGMYLVINEKENSKRLAYLSNMLTSRVNEVLRFSYLFLEIFLSAPHGSVYGYQKRDNNIFPVLGPYEYSLLSLQNDIKVIKQLQKGAISFLKNFVAYEQEKIVFNINTSFAAFCNFGLFPRKEDVFLWSTFHCDSDEFKMLASPKKLTFYITHPNNFLNDLKESIWPMGFLVKVFHTIAFNRIVFFVYTLLKKRMKVFFIWK